MWPVSKKKQNYACLNSKSESFEGFQLTIDSLGILTLKGKFVREKENNTTSN